MRLRLACTSVAWTLMVLGCESSTQPESNYSANSSASFVTDSLRYTFYSSTTLANATYRIHNGTDSTLVFPLCCDLIMRVDRLQGASWSVFAPLGPTFCPGDCSMYLDLKSDSTFLWNRIVRDTGRYRFVTIYGGLSRFGQYPDTLISNTFEAR